MNGINMNAFEKLQAQLLRAHELMQESPLTNHPMVHGKSMGPGTLHQHNQPEEDLHLRSETSNYILVATSDHDSLVSTVL